MVGKEAGIDGKDTRGNFTSCGNVLHLYWDIGYIDAYVCQNPSKCSYDLCILYINK